MPANYVLLEKITVGAAGASSVTFSSIPQTGYTDLVIKTSIRDTAATVGNAGMRLIFNGSGSGFSSRWVYGTGNVALSSSDSGSWIRVGQQPGANATANTFSNDEIYIPNYTGSANKSVSADTISENNGTEAYAYLVTGLWANSAAITSITIQSNSTAWAANSTFYLYGVAKLGTTPAIVPYATGGDTIMTDGTYWYHAFRSSGTFTPAAGKNLSCDILVVAGGGGSSGGVSGGGGAGGVLAYSAQSLVANTGYTVTVGAGGGSAANGSNSQFASLTASTGGGCNQANGGSGGGQNGPGAGAVGNGTSGQGNNGGPRGIQLYAGGGGGAGAVGGTGGGSRGGDGGAGVSTVTNWGSLSAALTTTGTGVSGFIAGGGGGSAWNGVTPNNTGGNAGSGGGGAGGEGGAGSAQATNGVANTGGGAGGDNTSGKTGGSGLVIVRYLV